MHGGGEESSMESSRRERERERRMMMRGPGSSGSVLREKGPGRVFNIGTNPEDFDLEGDYMEVSLRTKEKKNNGTGSSVAGEEDHGGVIADDSRHSEAT